jgi:GxxExxY protein
MTAWLVGNFYADLLIEGRILVENKALQALAPVHEAQLVNYLTAIGIEIGLLLNFGGPSLQFKRKWRTYRKTRGNPVNPVNPA